MSRQERKRKQAVEAVADPELAAAKRLAKNAGKQAQKKRKMAKVKRARDASGSLLVTEQQIDLEASFPGLDEREYIGGPLDAAEPSVGHLHLRIVDDPDGHSSKDDVGLSHLVDGFRKHRRALFIASGCCLLGHRNAIFVPLHCDVESGGRNCLLGSRRKLDPDKT